MRIANILRINLLAAKFTEQNPLKKCFTTSPLKTSGEIYEVILATPAMTGKERVVQIPFKKTLRNDFSFLFILLDRKFHNMHHLSFSLKRITKAWLSECNWKM